MKIITPFSHAFSILKAILEQHKRGIEKDTRKGKNNDQKKEKDKESTIKDVQGRGVLVRAGVRGALPLIG